jgi:hypothetical protein
MTTSSSLPHSKITRLKTLALPHFDGVHLLLTHDEDKKDGLAPQEKCGLQRLPEIDLESEPADVGTILRLKLVGRRYN